MVPRKGYHCRYPCLWCRHRLAGDFDSGIVYGVEAKNELGHTPCSQLSSSNVRDWVGGKSGTCPNGADVVGGKCSYITSGEWTAELVMKGEGSGVVKTGRRAATWKLEL